MIDHFLGDTFGVLSFQFWRIFLQCSARLPIHTLNYWTVQSLVPGSNWGVFGCDLAHRRSVVTLCMLYKNMCNPMHPLNGALPGPYVPVLVTLGAQVAHLYTCAPPRCRTSQYRMRFVPLSVSLWNDLADSVFDGVGLAGFRSRANVFLLT